MAVEGRSKWMSGLMMPSSLSRIIAKARSFSALVAADGRSALGEEPGRRDPRLPVCAARRRDHPRVSCRRLDPAVGIFHADRRERASLAFDLIDECRTSRQRRGSRGTPAMTGREPIGGAELTR